MRKKAHLLTFKIKKFLHLSTMSIPGEKQLMEEEIIEATEKQKENSLDKLKNMLGNDPWLSGAEKNNNKEIDVSKVVLPFKEESSDESDQNELNEDEKHLEELQERKERQKGSLLDKLNNLKHVKEIEITEEPENASEDEEDKPVKDVIDQDKFLNPATSNEMFLKFFSKISTQSKQNFEKNFHTTVNDSTNNNLISLQEAFATDDITADFLTEKEELLDSDVTKKLNKNNALPGWDEWAGPDAQKPLSRRALRRKRQRERKEKNDAREAAVKKRRDGNLSHVIINDEAINNQLKGYRPESVPFPFTSAEQYEKSLRMPLGKEFNTSEGFKALTKPTVITKLGQIIEPIEKQDAFESVENKARRKSKQKKVLEKTPDVISL